MEYVDPKELDDVVTFCFSYFFTSSLPLIMFRIFFFFEGGDLPRDNLFGGLWFFFSPLFSPPVCLNFRFLSSLLPALSLSPYLFLLLV